MKKEVSIIEKRLLMESVMDVSTLKELLTKKLMTPSLRRNAATWAITERSYTERRACQLVGIDPKTWRYASYRPDDKGARARLRDLAESGAGSGVEFNAQ